MAFQRNTTSITRSDLQTKLAANAADVNTAYLISNAVGSTKVVRVTASSVSALNTLADNLTDATTGVYDISGDTFVAQALPIVVSGSLTAANDAQYTVVASATFTDPPPVEGKGFTVTVRNGTATVGSVAYSVAGTVIKRIYHSGAWASYVYSQSLGAVDFIPQNLVINGDIAGSSITSSFYQISGNWCTVKVKVGVDAFSNSSGLSEVAFDLPVASAVASDFNSIGFFKLYETSSPTEITTSLIYATTGGTGVLFRLLYGAGFISPVYIDFEVNYPLS